MAQVNFNQQEAERLFELLDMAIKYKGMEIAQDALYFNQKIAQSMQQEMQAQQQPTVAEAQKEGDNE